MAQRRVHFKVHAGPNEGDTVSVDSGACRLIGRHLSDNETSFIDPNGNRVLDHTASTILSERLKEHVPEAPSFSVTAFDRGPDVIFSDDSISRAHAMLFVDPQGVGIIDLASTNGTYVNGVRISSALVQDGDVIAIGASEMLVALPKK
jgi:hypothetical protein